MYGTWRRRLLTVIGTATTTLACASSAHAANFVVTTTNPTGPGSLAEALGLANADGTTADTIQITATGTITLSGGVFFITGNTEIDGPGARQLTLDAHHASRVFTINNGQPVTITGMTMTNGIDDAGLPYGGGILNRDSAALTLRNVQVLNSLVSTAQTSLGGGIYSAGPLTIENSTIAGNVVDATGGNPALGGAFYAAAATIRSSTITGNMATGSAPSGGGAYVDGAGNISVIRNSTIAGNTATSGANLAIGAGHIISMRNNILANPLGGGADCTNTGTLTDEGFNLVSDASCANTQSTDIAGNPQLGALADNGGPTDTMLPALASPVVDHGTSSALTADQRGLTRPADRPDVVNGNGSDGSDIGAVELQLDPVIPPEQPPAQPPAATPGAITLGKPDLDKKKGTAELTATVNQAGEVVLSGESVKTSSATATGAGDVTLTVRAKGRARKKLKKNGKAKASFSVTFTPASATPATADSKVKLKLTP